MPDLYKFVPLSVALSLAEELQQEIERLKAEIENADRIRQEQRTATEETIEQLRKENLELKKQLKESAENMNRHVINYLREQNAELKKQAVERSEWVPLEYDAYADGNPVWDLWECQKCGHEHNGEECTLTAYCPGCGAIMI